jgi:hypothetical protein
MNPSHGLLNTLSVHPNDNVDAVLAIDCFYFSHMNMLSMLGSSMINVIGERVLSRPTALLLQIRARARQLFDVRA